MFSLSSSIIVVVSEWSSGRADAFRRIDIGSRFLCSPAELFAEADTKIITKLKKRRLIMIYAISVSR
jgi:hypothetical protein